MGQGEKRGGNKPRRMRLGAEKLRTRGNKRDAVTLTYEALSRLEQILFGIRTRNNM